MTIQFPRIFFALLLACVTGSSAFKNSNFDISPKPEIPVMPSKDTLLAQLLGQHPEFFDSLLQNNEQYRIQIIYTQINRGANGMPQLTHHYFNADPNLYFYPASTVKLPAAALSLQKINELNIPGLDKNATMITETALPGQTAVYNDPSSADGRPSIAHYIKKIFLVSDNDAYNRLYEFLGQDYLNRSLHKMGYSSVQLSHRLQLSLSDEQNRMTNPVKFYNGASQLIYQQPLQKSDFAYSKASNFLGTGYMQGNELVNRPFDFSQKNHISLIDLHTILQSIVLPETVPSRQRFNLTPEDYQFLYRYMSMKPGESSSPKYDSSYTDAYGKFLLFGGDGQIENNNIRIFNKIGDAYGFLQDVAYIVDFEKGVEFLLSASIYCNEDGIFNDDKYDYDKIGFPFLQHLGEVLYDYEVQRPRKVKPDLSQFRMTYY